MSRPVLLLVDPDPTSRLRRVDALRTDFEVHTPEADEEPVRLARRLRPDAVLLTLPRGRLQGTLRTCRILKTEAARTPRVGLLDPRGRLSSPDTALQSCHGDGYLGGEAPPEALHAFLDALLAGTRPITLLERRPGVLRRLFGR